MEKNSTLIDDSPAFLASFFTEDIYSVQPATVKSTSSEGQATTPSPVSVKRLEAPGKEDAGSNISVLMSYPNRQEMPVKDKNFLVKILSAVSLDMRQVKMTNVATLDHFDFKEVAGSSRQVITLGLGLGQLPGGVTKPDLYQFSDMQLLCVWDLQKIAQDNDKKRFLWERLQKMFLVK